ncbi:MAG: hypothetical protein II951_04205 [Bacteroidales bacterium]|nr:hypothetical protein [Bacteroidales bacterium]
MKATDTFRHPAYRHNCAQALAFKYHADLGLSPEQALEKFADLAAGRAPGGLCGALFAAQQILPSKADEVTKAFADKTDGYLTCKALKGEGRVPCPLCVDLADSVVERLKE